MNVKIGDEIFVPGTQSRAFVKEIRYLASKKCNRIEVEWKGSDGGFLGKSNFFDFQEGTEWFKNREDVR